MTSPGAGDAYYRDFARAYEEHTRGVPGDVEFYVDLARQADGPVVELGVGTGRIAVPVALEGIPVIGIDREPAMLAIAREKAAAAGVEDLLDLREGDMRTFELGNLQGRAALVTIPFRTFLHNLTVEDQRATLDACARALRAGGRLALNVFNPDLALIERWRARGPRHWEPFQAWQGFEVNQAYERPVPIARTTLRVRDGQGRWRRTSFSLRYVFREEMQALLEAAGFAVESLSGDFAGNAFEAASPEMVWVARRTGRAVSEN